jgi:ketosteroid isomerase-like protein
MKIKFEVEIMSMSKVLRVLFLIIFIPLIGIAQNKSNEIAADKQQAIEKAIIHVHDRMQLAAQQGQVDSLYQYVLDVAKGVIIEDGKLRLTRQEALETTRQAMQGLKDVSYSYAQKYITVISPTVALWVGQGTSSATLKDGRQISAPFAETIVFVLKNGQWKVLHAHRSIPNR